MSDGLTRAAHRRIADTIAGLAARIEDLDRRLARTVLDGTVASIDPEKGTARVRIDGDLDSHDIPWTDSAGAVSTFFPLSAGERVIVVSPNGDIARAQLMRGGRTDANPAPHDKAGEAAIGAGATRIVIGPDGVRITGDVTIEGRTAITGPALTHNGTDVGDTHAHTGVTPGGDTTGPPT